MATITLKGNQLQTSGDLPQKGAAAPDFSLVRTDMSEANLGKYSGKKVLNIFPSIDTPVCATSVRTFNQRASGKSRAVRRRSSRRQIRTSARTRRPAARKGCGRSGP